MVFINVDSTVHEGDLLTALQAAKVLGVKVQTLYAYASRGLLRSFGGPRSRGRRYLRADVERLRQRHEARSGHEAVAATALRWGSPVLDSSITGLDARGPRYRGYVAADLVKDAVRFEAVAELLWNEGKVGAPVRDPHDAAVAPWPPPSRERLRLLVRPGKGTSAIAALLEGVARVAATDPSRFGAGPEAEVLRARHLVPLLAAAWAPTKGAGGGSVAARLARGFGLPTSPRIVAALDAALVLLADHELNPSAFAARIAASSGADLYACLIAALATASGPRHAAATERVEALLDEVGAPSRAAAFVEERARRGEGIPGFHHPVYAAGDPRATPLLALAARQTRPRRMVATALALVEAMARAGREAPSVDVGLVALMEALGAPRGAAAFVFVVGRSAGWVAHVLEQRTSDATLRPRARYVGA